MYRILAVVFVFTINVTLSQTLNGELVRASFEGGPQKTSSKKKLLLFKKQISYFNPLNYIGAGFLYTYQQLVSEQIQASCTYKISCSEFTRCSIQKHGFFIGTLKGFNQLSECIDGARYEHPRMFIDKDNKIINSVETKDK